jgi:hypothetical protein
LIEQLPQLGVRLNRHSHLTWAERQLVQQRLAGNPRWLERDLDGESHPSRLRDRPVRCPGKEEDCPGCGCRGMSTAGIHGWRRLAVLRPANVRSPAALEAVNTARRSEG